MASETVVIIDLNGPLSFACGHIPTAIDLSIAKKISPGFSPKIKTSSLSLIAEVLTANLSSVGQMLQQNLASLTLGIFLQEFPDGKDPDRVYRKISFLRHP